MRTKAETDSEEAEKRVRDIRRATRRQYSAEEKIRIVIAGLRGEDSIAELCRKEGINQNLYYRWSKDFLEAGKKWLAGATAREATSDEVKEIQAQARQLKELLWVRMRRQIARTRADFPQFSEMSDKREAGWWRGRDLNPRDPFSTRCAEFRPSLDRYSARIKSSRAEENLFARDSARLRSSPVPSFPVPSRELCDSRTKRALWVSRFLPLMGSQQFGLGSFDHQPVVPRAGIPSGELVEKFFGVLEISDVEALGEPVVDVCEHRARLVAATLPLEQPGEANRRAQFENSHALRTRGVDRRTPRGLECRAVSTGHPQNIRPCPGDDGLLHMEFTNRVGSVLQCVFGFHEALVQPVSPRQHRQEPCMWHPLAISEPFG